MVLNYQVAITIGGGGYIQFNTLANVNDENLYNLGSIFM